MAKANEFNCKNVIAELYCTCNCESEIIKATEYARSIICCIVASLKAEKGVEWTTYSSRNDLKCTLSCWLKKVN